MQLHILKVIYLEKLFHEEKNIIDALLAYTSHRTEYITKVYISYHTNQFIGLIYNHCTCYIACEHNHLHVDIIYLACRDGNVPS